jgi:anti-sigma28 factor (negative regulator of flagellin synthesis)
MRSHGDAAYSTVGPSSPQRDTTPAQETQKGRARLVHADLMSSSPRLWEIRQAGQLIAHTSEIREIRIVVLRNDIESGLYKVRAEQVAEKVMKDHLLDLFHD